MTTSGAGDAGLPAFLALPPELRNQIYEYTARDTATINVRAGSILHASPLSLVCRQIRKEYQGIFTSEAPTFASKVIFNVTNFDIKDVCTFSEALSPLPSGAKRTYKLRTTLTNTFDRYLDLLRDLAGTTKRKVLETDQGVEIEFDEHEIIFDHRTFDVEYARHRLLKIAWCLKGSKGDWTRIKAAFEEAIRRYDQEVAMHRHKKARKRKAKRRQMVAARKAIRASKKA